MSDEIVSDLLEDPPQPARIRTLGIPVLNRGDLLLRCLLSVDRPVENLFIVNNGHDKTVVETIQRAQRRDLPNAAMFGEVVVESHKNLGCGPSWNHIIRSTPGAWLICGNDIQFSPGDLGKVAAVLEANQDASIICGMGYSCYCFTETGMKKVGLFDENFFPAYYEDNDHFRRVALSGAKAVGVPEFKAVHGEAPYWGSSTIKASPDLERKNVTTFGNNRDYYVRKWGGEPGKERFKKPFNRDVPLDFWEFDHQHRVRNSLF